ncbi:MAG: hypothetical protein K8T20_09970, partial [Planctomycetes bacterium]|nr:hypothetical protein [Planctomycetota bacterium]
MTPTLRTACWTVLALTLASRPARADDESEAREAIRSLIDDLMKSDTSRELALRETIQKCKDAGRLWMEETVAHPLRREEHGEFGTGLLYVFGERRDDLVAPVRGLLKSASEDDAVYGVNLIHDLELGPKLAGELLGLFDRKDKAVLWIRNGAFKGVTDPKVVERLVAEAGKTGDCAEVAVGALADIETPEAHAFLRSVAASETETAVRRDWALQGLAPFLDAEDERVAREGLASGEEKLATAAFIAFCNSKKAPPPEVLRKARPKIWDQMAGEV